MTRISPLAFAFAFAAIGVQASAHAAVEAAAGRSQAVRSFELAMGPGTGRCVAPASGAVTQDSVTARTGRANPSGGEPVIVAADIATTDAVTARVARANPADGGAVPALQASVGCGGGTTVL